MPLLTKTAIITHIFAGDRPIWVRVQFVELPVDFGFDHRRLRGAGSGFFLHKLEGYKREKKFEDYCEYSPQGLAVGVKVLCDVDLSIPQGLISSVKPFTP